MSVLLAVSIAAGCFTADLGVNSVTGNCPDPIQYEAPAAPEPPDRIEDMSWKTFSSIPNGTRVLNHGYDQCVALANKYHEEELGGSFVGVGSAFQWWTEFDSRSTLTSIYTKSQKPVAGAVFVTRAGGIYDPRHGHIGVVLSVNPNGSFNTLEQNAGTWRYTGRYTRSMQDVLGFLVPKNNPATPKPTPDKKSEKEDDVQAIYYKQGKNYVVGLFNEGSGFFSKYTTHDSRYNNRIAGGLKTGNYVLVTKSHFEAFEASLTKVRQGK